MNSKFCHDCFVLALYLIVFSFFGLNRERLAIMYVLFHIVLIISSIIVKSEQTRFEGKKRVKNETTQRQKCDIIYWHETD